MGDRGEAEDLVQETLFEVARRWPRVRRMEHPIAYARRILVNRAVGGARGHARRRRELAAEAAPERPDPRAESSDVDGRDELMSALAALPPRHRAALRARAAELPWRPPAAAVGVRAQAA